MFSGELDLPRGPVECQPGDRVLASKFAYRLSGPRRGDIVVFKSSESLREPL